MFKIIDNEFYFTFNGINPLNNEEIQIDSRFLKMALKAKPVEKLSKMKTTELDYDSLDGSLYMDNTTFSNTEIEMEFYIRKDMEIEVREALKMLTLTDTGNISFGWEEGLIRSCRLLNNIEISEVEDDEYTYECSISFALAPYKFAVEGEEFLNDTKGRLDLRHGSRFNNFYMDSFPYIYIDVLTETELGGELQVFTISNLKNNLETGKEEVKSSQVIKLYGVAGSNRRRVCIDCINRYVYAVDENYGENMNYLLHMESDFPVLKSGLNMISFSAKFNELYTGGFNIIPNWRTL